MKKWILLLTVAAALAGSSVWADPAGLWAKYTAPDKSYSFHYPAGWQVQPDSAVIGVENPGTDEQLLFTAIPFDGRQSPADLAAGFIRLLQQDNPKVRASNWRSEPASRERQVVFDLTDQKSGQSYLGLGVVIKTDGQATWFSYLAPAAGYLEPRGSAILQGFMGSLTEGSASRNPAIDYTVGASVNLDRNAQSFLFVLEFALGAPFTKGQEDLIVSELKSGWRDLSAAELAKYDQYPVLAQKIMKLGQRDLEDLRATLEKSIRDWLDETNPADRTVRAIRGQLQLRSRVLIAGDPPLTEMSLTAYGELLAFARLLRQNPQATPEQIPVNSVSEIKKQVRVSWNTLAKDDQKDIATTPGLWMCVRTLLRNGAKAEQEKIRSQLRQLDDAIRNQTLNNSAASKKPMDMTTHWCLMQMQQRTFNSYMWSRGFNYLPATGKMW